MLLNECCGFWLDLVDDVFYNMVTQLRIDLCVPNFCLQNSHKKASAATVRHYFCQLC